ncbi:MAG: YbjN domain-containing protein [Hyphomicrobiales bacterium]|nr:YbjN domain-containing protein [Hyphomicrobiales bacterium]
MGSQNMEERLSDFAHAQTGHPIDMLEELARSQSWPWERLSRDDMNLTVAGSYADYQLAVNWRDDLCGLHIACLLGLKTPPKRRAAMLDLLARVNTKLWLGHFDIWEEEGTLLFRNTMLLSDKHVSVKQCNALVAHAFKHCEQFLPAFQYLLWADYGTQQALDACLFETKGDA